ncbi:MAG: SLC13/DASS family transporter [Bacteroidales bacterium]|nr:SLC13/DASS family transporter [Bacteroidales bacterium]
MSETSTKSRNYVMWIKLAISVFVLLFFWIVPASSYGLTNITVVEQRVIAVFAFAFAMWVTEAVPSWTSSVLVIVLLLLTCSNGSISFLKVEGVKMISYKSLMYAFADPTIMLFLGGFVIAAVASKMGVDVQLAKALLKLFGKKSEFVLLGFLLVTGLFSMFISNTATAAMMLTFMAPVLRHMPVDGKGKIALAMAIPIGANIGGTATPIGTPPNAIALKFLNDPEGLNLGIGFGDWFGVMFPYALVLLLIAWALLMLLFPFKKKTIELVLEGETKHGWQLTVTYITMAVTIFLWMFDKVTGLNANIVAMIPIAIFCVTGIFTKEDLNQINWSVLWLVAGGFALGTALYETGLDKHLIEAIPFQTWSPIVVIIAASVVCWILSNIIANTAAANLLIPVMVTLAVGMREMLVPFGGETTMLLSVTLAASLAMCLPISTPPNAIAYSTGMIETKDMMKVGVIMGVIGLVLAISMLVVIGKLGYFA